MRRALQLARKNENYARPNPSVGAVIVYRDQIIGEGYTSNFGGNHAEINAINSVDARHLEKLSQATLYVTLEPCAHFGKTPPCALTIAKHNIPKVVVGYKDPNPKVSGKGLKLMHEKGIEVLYGILEEECAWVHRKFLSTFADNRPYITLKWAETTDQFIAPIKEKQLQGSPYPISSAYSKQWAHKLRSEHGGIVIGAETLRIDQPRLNNRLWAGLDPRIFVLGGDDTSIPEFWNTLKSKIYLLQQNPIKQNSGTITRIRLNSKNEALDQLFGICKNEAIDSLLIEGGSNLLQQFIDRGLWNEAFVFQSKTLLRSGIKAPVIMAKAKRISTSGCDSLKYYVRT